MYQGPPPAHYNNNANYGYGSPQQPQQHSLTQSNVNFSYRQPQQPPQQSLTHNNVNYGYEQPQQPPQQAYSDPYQGGGEQKVGGHQQGYEQYGQKTNNYYYHDPERLDTGCCDNDCCRCLIICVYCMQCCALCLNNN